MNLLDEDFSNSKEKKDTSKVVKIIIVFIILIILIIIGIISYIMYLQSTILRVYLNDVENLDVKNLLSFEEDGSIYVPIAKISSYLGYECHTGEYFDRSPDNSKCYIESEKEVVNFSLNSDKIYKLNLENSDDNYTYVYMENPVKAKNGELYIATEGMEKAFNTFFEYDEQKNRISIYTIPYLIESYSNLVLDYGYTDISEVFENQKAILKDMLVVTNGKYYGVINLVDGTEIIECQYDDIIYQESVGDFIVGSNGKYGIIGTNKRAKVSITYDSIELMDYDAELYVVKMNNYYGVIDLNGNTVIYPEVDQIGVDISNFESNDLKTGYILIDSVIPVKKNNKWGLFNLEGEQLVDFEYDSFGSTRNSSSDKINLLVIPTYNVLVGCIENRFTLLDSSGEQPIKAFVDEMYMKILNGEKSYKMVANGTEHDVEEYLERLGVKKVTTNNLSTTQTNTTNTTYETQNTNRTNQDNTVQNNTTQQDEGEQQVEQEEQNNEEMQNDNEQQISYEEQQIVEEQQTGEE